MNNFFFVVKLIGVISLIGAIGFFVVGQNETVSVLISISLFSFALIAAVKLSNYYLSYHTNRRRK